MGPAKALPKATKEYRKGPPSLYFFLERSFESGSCEIGQTLQQLSVFMHAIHKTSAGPSGRAV